MASGAGSERCPWSAPYSSPLPPGQDPVRKRGASGGFDQAALRRTCCSIQPYVVSSPSRSVRFGAQPSLLRISRLSELRPRTPIGPELPLPETLAGDVGDEVDELIDA